jgi:hypothetical protein
MPQRLIPVVLVQNVLESELQKKLETSAVINLLDVLTSDEYKTIPRPKHSVPDVLIVINAEVVDREAVVTTGLLLRNTGHQVFVATSVDFEDLLEIATDVSDHIKGIADKDIPFQAEIMVTEHAMEILGDITPIVKYFEAEFLVENSVAVL